MGLRSWKENAMINALLMRMIQKKHFCSMNHLLKTLSLIMLTPKDIYFIHHNHRASQGRQWN